MNPSYHKFILTQLDENTYLFKISIRELLRLNIENWEHNRPPDESRFEEIKNYLCKPSNLVNSALHFYYNSKTDNFEIIDGSHRYYTIISLTKEECELIYNKNIIIFVYINKTDGELSDIFINLNKSISIPKLYSSMEYSLNQRQIIDNIVLIWKEKYKPHFSHSSSFKIPQINREAFYNLLTELYEKFKIRSESKLLDILDKLNNYIKDYVEDESKIISKLPKKFTANQLEKCKKTGCYLFLYKEGIILDIISNLAFNSEKKEKII
jgi:hypothetical protein